MSRKILIFDTTLRDGEQSPGCSMNTKEKVEMAKQLEKLNVDIIEAGFAAASPGDLHAIQEVSKAVKGVSFTIEKGIGHEYPSNLSNVFQDIIDFFN